MWGRVAWVGPGAREELQSGIWQVECCLCLQLRHLGAEKTAQKQRRPHRRNKDLISNWGHPQLPETPLSLRTVGRLSEALVGTAICLSLDGFIFALFTSLCFPRVASGVNVSFESFSIMLKREGILLPLPFYLDNF